MKKRSMGAWMSKAGVAALLLGVVAMGTGCEAVDGMMVVARTTATDALNEAVGGVIAGAMDSILGSVIPGSDGA